jgi:hypothetical protein
METKVEVNQETMKKPSLSGMIFSPAVQFERMKTNMPIGLPLFYLMVLFAVAGGIGGFVGLNSSAFKELDVHIPKAFTIGTAVIGSMVSGIIGFLVTALFYKICMMFMSNDTKYKKLFAIVMYASVISIIGGIINGIINLAVGGEKVTSFTSLAPLVAENKTWHAIAQNFDIFRIWHYVVLGMGLHIAAGLSKNKVVILLVILFVITIGISSLGAFIPGQ